MLLFYSIIQMQQGKENDFANFSKLLRKLQIDNLAMPELRQLKQQHAYLQKLRSQRTKIEQLKSKHDAAEMQLQIYTDDLNQQKQLINEQHRTIELLQDKLQESERKRTQLENALARTAELEKEKSRLKNTELIAELQELRKISKSKDIAIFEMEDQFERRTSQLKDQWAGERRKVINQWEQKLRYVLAQKGSIEQQNQELKELVTRQHKALQLQNQQFEDANKKNQELTDSVTGLEEQLEEAMRLKTQAEEQAAEMADIMTRMEGELNLLRNGQTAKDQVEELRKKVSELAKGEIERIEFIVNEFE